MSSKAAYRKQVRDAICEAAQYDLSYLFMNVLAATIASYGLLANSPAVVIGAMIVALLLGPIVGTALALVDGDGTLLRKSLFTLFMGTLGVFIVSYSLGLLHRDIPITQEILARTRPNLFDLMVALAGGAAGAYATVSPRLSTSLVGVAVATALVPPLASGSILLARGQNGQASGAFLLAFTNMVAIQVAAAAVLWVTGFRHVRRSEGATWWTFLRRTGPSLAVLLLLGIVLTANLRQVVSQQLFETTVRGRLGRAVESGAGEFLDEVWIEVQGNRTIVRAVVRGPTMPTRERVAAMEAALPSPPDGTELELRIRYVNAVVIGRDGVLNWDNGPPGAE